MKYIAHRGLIAGPNTSLENNPEQIKYCLKKGLDCEIDVWLVDHQLYLGHDKPVYHIGDGFLTEPGLWIHAKNLDALRWLTTTNLNYFWHQEDDFTLTSHGFIWTYPGKPLTSKSIMVLPEWQDPSLSNAKSANCFGICSDYIEKLL